MSDTRHIIYVDESGNEDLFVEKGGATNLFVVAAVIVERNQLREAEAIVQEARQRYFGGAELKSSGVGGNVRRRGDVLEALAALPALVYFLVVDKAVVHKDSGLSWRRSFRKFIGRYASAKLYRRFPDAEIVADRHGGQDFMAEYERYVDRRVKESLFDQAEFRFTEDKERDPLVQAADFFGGTVRRCVEANLDDPERLLLRHVEPLLLAFHDWPPVLPYFSGKLDQPREKNLETDWLIQRQAILEAKHFVQKNREAALSDPDLQLQVECVEHLLYRFQFVDADEYVHTDELCEHLSRAEQRLSTHALRTRVIAKLRDAGVLVSSSAAGGYKIPSSVEDVQAFLDIAQRNVEPLVARVEAYREAVKAATTGRLDVLDESRYEVLRRLVDAARPSLAEHQAAGLIRGRRAEDAQ